jgi:hypothetical protein
VSWLIQKKVDMWEERGEKSADSVVAVQDQAAGRILKTEKFG